MAIFYKHGKRSQQIRVGDKAFLYALGTKLTVSRIDERWSRVYCTFPNGSERPLFHDIIVPLQVSA
jgi:hypothetical protein